MSTPAAREGTLALKPILRIQAETVLGRLGLVSVATILLVAVVVTLVVLTRARPIGAEDGGGIVSWLAVAHGIAFTVALLFPGVVWEGLPPHRRLALHVQPLPRRQHELLRVLVGAGFVAIAVTVLYLMAFVLHLSLGPAVPRLGVGGWALAVLSLAIPYLFGSVAGLATASTTGTVLRVVIWGLVGAMLLTVIGEEVPMVKTGLLWIADLAWWGEWGLWSAAAAGFHALQASASPADGAWGAVLLWLAVAGAATWWAAGRVPRSGRG